MLRHEPEKADSPAARREPSLSAYRNLLDMRVTDDDVADERISGSRLSSAFRSPSTIATGFTLTLIGASILSLIATVLGHDYRVIVHVTVWGADDVLQVPVAALFRQGNQWAAYVVRNGRARVAEVAIGHRNNQTAEIVSGLMAGDTVILHPSDRIRNESGVTHSQRE